MFLKFEHTDNARDLGGIPTIDGKRVKSGLLYRTAELDESTPDDIRRLSEDYHIRYILDFRDPIEYGNRPDLAIPGAENIAIPVLPRIPANDYEIAHADPMTIFNRIYREFALDDRPAAAYREFFDVLLRGDGPVLWHCTQGKDRTGIGAILLLTALGVSWEEAERDYFLTNEAMRPIYEAFMAKATTERERSVADKVIFVMPECLGIFTSLVQEHFGGIMGYIKTRVGLTDDEIARLKELYTE